MTAEVLALDDRAARHRALGDPARLAVVDALAAGDATPGELRVLLGISWNLLAFHLGILERAGIVSRSASEGDRRRRYVRLRPGAVTPLVPVPDVDAAHVLFVCTHNAARSQFAAALWRARTGRGAASAGTHPAPAVHPLAVEVAAEYGLDLADAIPRGYDETVPAGLVISVCDRARESALPTAPRALHWSIPDPVGGDRFAFSAAFADIAERIKHVARVAA